MMHRYVGWATQRGKLWYHLQEGRWVVVLEMTLEIAKERVA
jgi:hypothetical protein